MRRGNIKRFGFSLIELLVVLAIIVLLITLSVPSINALITSNQTSQAIATLTGLSTTAQTAAEANCTPVGIRIEQAFKTVNKTLTVNSEPQQFAVMDKNLDGSPKYLPYQQARLIIFATQLYIVAGKPDPTLGGHQLNSPVALPANIWLAPMNCLEDNWALDDNSLLFQPLDMNAAKFNRLDTFYIIFNRFGELTECSSYSYSDQTQPYMNGNQLIYPLVKHPDSSNRGVLLYNREKFGYAKTDIARKEFLNKSQSLNISRTMASVVSH